MLHAVMAQLEPIAVTRGLRLDPRTVRWSIYNNHNQGAATSSVVAFLFTSASSYPAIVVKLSRHWQNIEREYRALLKVSDLCPGRVPEPYLHGSVGDMAFVAMKGLRAASLSERRFDRDFPLVLDALFDLHAATRDGLMEDEDLERELLEPLRRFEMVWASDAALIRTCGNLRGLFHGLVAGELPRIPQHGDFSLRNLVRSPEGWVQVIDWEEYGSVVVPGYDLVVLFVGLAGRGGLGDAGLRRLLSHGLREYAVRFKIPERWLLPLVQLHLIRFFLFCDSEKRERPASMAVSQLQQIVGGRDRIGEKLGF